MLMLAESEWYVELAKQSPAAAVMLVALLAFLKYLSNEAARQERIEIGRQAHLKEMSDSCHAAHRTVVAESNAAISALTNVLDENNRILGRQEAFMQAQERRRGPVEEPRSSGPGRAGGTRNPG